MMRGALIWVVLAFIVLGWARAMMRRTERAYDDTMPEAKRFRHNTLDLFASNAVSGSRTQELLNDAAAAGAQHVRDLLGPTGKNANRSLTNKLLKNSGFPPLYNFEVRYLNLKSGREERTKISMLLPHELLAMLVRFGDRDAIYATDGMDPQTLEHLRLCEANAGEHLVGLGLWGDGAPCNWDRTESLEVFSINLPGLTGRSFFLLIGGDAASSTGGHDASSRARAKHNHQDRTARCGCR